MWGPALRAAALPGAAAPFARRATRLLVLAAAVGAAATAAGIVLEGATAAGTTFWGALDARIVHEVLQTHFGAMWAVRLGAWLLLGTGLAVAALRRMPVAVAVPSAAPAALRRAVAVAGAGGAGPNPAGVRGSAQPGGPPLPDAPRARNLPGGPAAAIGFGIVGCALALTPALAGHAHTQSPVALLVPLRRHPRRGDERVAGRPRVPAVRGPGGDADARAAPTAPACSRRRSSASRRSRSSSVLALAATGTIQALVEGPPLVGRSRARRSVARC